MALSGLSSLSHAQAPAALPPDIFAPEPAASTAQHAAPELSSAHVDALHATLRNLLRSPTVAGHTLSARVVALSSGQVVFEQGSDELLKPASNTKLISTAAAFGILGEDWRPASRVLARNAPSGSTVKGDVVLHGVHDVSWSTLFYPIPHYVANRLVDQLHAQGIRRIDGDLLIHGLFVVDGHRFGTLNTSVERNQAAAMFRERLAAKGITLIGHVKVSDRPLPNRYDVELARWEGPALSSIAAHINRMSHNEFADMLMLAMAQADGSSATYDNGFRAIETWLTAQGLAHEGLRLRDGSGLSHDNRVSATQLTELIRVVQNQPWADAWNASLSVAGMDGTYINRMHGASTRGCAWLKSGTINGVITTAGVLNHRGTGERYAVAFLMNEVRHQPSARASQDQLMAAVGDTLLSSNRPSPPDLQTATVNERDQVQLQWKAAQGTRHYVIETRDDDSPWRTAHVLDAGTTEFHLPRGAAPRAYRVLASNDEGLSDPSRVLIAGGQKRAPRVLVVDGNERWLADPAPENGLRAPHGFLTQFLAPLTGFRVESLSNHSLATHSVQDRDVVLFALGEEALTTEALSADERAWIEAHLQRGGGVIVAGSEVAWDLATNVPDGVDYLDRVFGAEFVDDSAGNTVACLQPGLSPESAGTPVCAHFWTPGWMKIEWPDALRASRGESCMHYAGMSTDACVLHGSAALVGFPLESIDDRANRSAVVRQLIHLVSRPNQKDKS